MQRRTYLSGAAAGVALLAGCGSSPPSGAAALNSDWADPAITGTEDGQLLVRIVVTNTRDSEQEAMLYVYADIDGGKRYRKARDVTLGAAEQQVYEVAFEEVTLERYRNGGTVEKELD